MSAQSDRVRTRTPAPSTYHAHHPLTSTPPAGATRSPRDTVVSSDAHHHAHATNTSPLAPKHNMALLSARLMNYADQQQLDVTNDSSDEHPSSGSPSMQRSWSSSATSLHHQSLSSPTAHKTAGHPTPTAPSAGLNSTDEPSFGHAHADSAGSPFTYRTRYADGHSAASSPIKAIGTDAARISPVFQRTLSKSLGAAVSASSGAGSGPAVPATTTASNTGGFPDELPPKPKKLNPPLLPSLFVY